VAPTLDWHALNVLLASRQRRGVFPALRTPQSPSRLAAKLHLPPSNVSRALGDLRRNRAMECRGGNCREPHAPRFDVTMIT